MRSTSIFPILLSFGLAGCGQGVYSTTVANDGSVLILNRLTGSVKKVEGNHLVEVHQLRQLGDPMFRPKLDDKTIPKQPITIGGEAEYRDDSMLVRVSIRPVKPNMTPEEWATWRSKMQDCRAEATISPTFIDEHGFDVDSRKIPLKDMKRNMDANGALVGMSIQLALSLEHDTYYSIKGWYVGWGNWQSCTGIRLEDVLPPSDKPNNGDGNGT